MNVWKQQQCVFQSGGRARKWLQYMVTSIPCAGDGRTEADADRGIQVTDTNNVMHRTPSHANDIYTSTMPGAWRELLQVSSKIPGHDRQTRQVLDCVDKRWIPTSRKAFDVSSKMKMSSCTTNNDEDTLKTIKELPHLKVNQHYTNLVLDDIIRGARVGDKSFNKESEAKDVQDESRKGKKVENKIVPKSDVVNIPKRVREEFEVVNERSILFRQSIMEVFAAVRNEIEKNGFSFLNSNRQFN